VALTQAVIEAAQAPPAAPAPAAPIPAAPAPAAPPPAATTSPELRIIDATLSCICRWGVAKTTLDDVARQAGCSRATVYRLFPGGKDGLIEAVASAEVARFFAAIATEINSADSLEDALVLGMSEAGRRLTSHPALQYLLEHEPGAVLPHLAFRAMEQVLAAARGFAAPLLAQWLDTEDAERTAEWAARLVVSYAITPAQGVVIEDEGSVRALVRSFVMPGLQRTNQGGSTNG
jgi:AcrR family transcriptional regulator